QGVQGGEPGALHVPESVYQGTEPGLRHGSLRSGGIRLGAIRGFAKMSARAGLGRKRPVLVCHRPQGNADVRLSPEFLKRDFLREGYRSRSRRTPKGGTRVTPGGVRGVLASDTCELLESRK